MQITSARGPLADWLSYFVPRDIFRTSSSYNRDIRVQTFMGKRHCMVDGSQQSGAYVEMLWRRSFAAFEIERLRPKNILVLGVGGGTVIHMLHELFPRASITAIDIDPAMIAIGKKYFGLGSLRRLRLVRADARTFVAGPRKKYDLIIVDLFSGARIPEFVETRAFFSDLKKPLGRGGRVVVNYLREKEYQRKSGKFADNLRVLFTVRDYPIFRNRFFLLE